MRPLVSIIMPFYNAAEYMSQALDSVLKQDHEHLEIICINDGSTDGTSRSLAQYKEKDKRVVIIENEKNLGLIDSLNKALTYVKGDYFARMDADDDMPLNRISEQVAFLEGNKDVHIVSSGYHYMDGEGKQLNYVSPVATTPGALKYLSLFVTGLTHAAICARVSLIRSNVFTYDKNYPHAEDLELFSRLAWSGIKLSSMDRSLYKVRLHSQSVSQVNYDQQVNSNLEVLKRNLAMYLGEKTPEEDAILRITLCKINRAIEIREVHRSFDILEKIIKKVSDDMTLSPLEKDEVKRFVKQHKLNIIIQANKFRSKNKSEGNVAFFLSSVSLLGFSQYWILTKKIFS